MSPAANGKNRCRMHGGAKGNGAPKGERNGAYRHGRFTAEEVAFRRGCRAVLDRSRALLADLTG